MPPMLTKITDRRAMRRWARAANDIDSLDPLALKHLHAQADRLSRRLNKVLRAAEGRLTAPRAETANRALPTHTDWTYQPQIWTESLRPSGLAQVACGTRLCSEAALFHDCSRKEISWRQTRTHSATSTARFASTLDILGFDGTYLSLALDLPNPVLTNLTRHHIIGLTAAIETERPIDIYARLNLRHGPNIAQITRKFDDTSTAQPIDFDLSTTDIDETRLNRAWIDLIFEAPALNRICIQDLSLNRHPRAEV